MHNIHRRSEAERERERGREREGQRETERGREREAERERHRERESALTAAHKQRDRRVVRVGVARPAQRSGY